MITFGAPRTCFRDTATEYNQKNVFNSGKTLYDISFRVVNHADLVARIPPAFLGYRHVGQIVFIDKEDNLHNHVYADQVYQAHQIRGFDKKSKLGERKKEIVLPSVFKRYPLLTEVILHLVAFLYKMVPWFYFKFWMRFAESGIYHLLREYRPSIMGPDVELQSERVPPKGINELLGRVFMFILAVGMLGLGLLGLLALIWIGLVLGPLM